MELLSTTRLAAKLGIPRDELVTTLSTKGLLIVDKRPWELTKEGKNHGGTTQKTTDGNNYVVWPDDLGERLGLSGPGDSDTDRPSKKTTNGRLTATAIARVFEIAPPRINLILAEMGWIKKHIKGWAITPVGSAIGGTEHEVENSGGHYVTWPKSVIQNRSLVAVIESMKEENSSESDADEAERIEKRIESFRTGNAGTYRTKDGHWVRSRAEVIIDDALYDYGLVHAYERRLPVEEEAYCDFYLPSHGVYIEYWGLEEKPKYAKRKEAKIQIYERNELALIQLSDRHLASLDDHLPVLLLKHGIRVY